MAHEFSTLKTLMAHEFSIMKKCFICDREGKERDDLQLRQVVCDYHFRIFKEAEGKTKIVLEGMRITSQARKRMHVSYFERNRTRMKTRKLIEGGLIVKTPCEVCGEKNTQVHHYDYLDPINVSFFCVKHHREWHKKNSY